MSWVKWSTQINPLYSALDVRKQCFLIQRFLVRALRCWFTFFEENLFVIYLDHLFLKRGESFWTSSNLNLNEFHRHHILPVIPHPVIQPLPQDFDGRLCTVLFLQRHVYIVHKHNTSLTQWGPKHTYNKESKMKDQEMKWLKSKRWCFTEQKRINSTSSIL